jgi:quercetin dioxygenase-like cupin family protein
MTPEGETITEKERRQVVIVAERPDLTVTWSRYASGEPGPDLHVHREHTDAFYVLEGELTFPVGPGGAERLRVAAGGFVAVPPNVVHTYVNESGADARWLNFHVPDTGFASYLRGLRHGRVPEFDQFDPPADGGRPAADVIVGEPRDIPVELPELSVAEVDAAGPRRPAAVYFPLGDDRELEIRTVTT